MSHRSRILCRFALFAGVLASCSSACLADGIAATATYTGTQVSPSMYDYQITLNNTGTTTIGTFWFAWVPGAGFLTSVPSSVSNPAGWSDVQTSAGGAIRWTSTTNLLAAGDSLSGFEFKSAETPGQLLLDVAGTGTGAGLPVTTSFVYIGAPLTDPGFEFAAQPTAVAATPEPGSLTLLLSGAVAAGAFLRRRRMATAGI